jgi:hypothetical protein
MDGSGDLDCNRRSCDHTSFMKTPPRLSRLIGWVGRCAAALVALAFCVSAVAANGDKNVVTTPAKAPVVRAVPKRQIFMFTSASAIPQPIDRVASPIATTAIPITVIKNDRR